MHMGTLVLHTILINVPLAFAHHERPPFGPSGRSKRQQCRRGYVVYVGGCSTSMHDAITLVKKLALLYTTSLHVLVVPGPPSSFKSLYSVSSPPQLSCTTAVANGELELSGMVKTKNIIAFNIVFLLLCLHSVDYNFHTSKVLNNYFPGRGYP